MVIAGSTFLHAVGGCLCGLMRSSLSWLSCEVNLGRYQAPIHVASRTLCEFSVKAYLFSISCLSMGLSVSGPKKKTAAAAAASSLASGEQAAGAGGDEAGAKTLKQFAHQPWDSNAVNQLQRAGQVFSSLENYFIQRVVVRVLHPTSEFHSRSLAAFLPSASKLFCLGPMRFTSGFGLSPQHMCVEFGGVWLLPHRSANYFLTPSACHLAGLEASASLYPGGVNRCAVAQTCPIGVGPSPSVSLSGQLGSALPPKSFQRAPHLKISFQRTRPAHVNVPWRMWHVLRLWVPAPGLSGVLQWGGCLQAFVAKPRQSKALRSLGATAPFELDMVRGNFAHTERLSMFSILFSKGYGDLGIEVDWREETLSTASARIAANDSFVEMLSDLSVAIVEQHCRRNLVFSHGLPRRQTCLQDAELGPMFIAELKQDLAIHKLVQECDFDGHDEYMARSVFNLPSVHQLVKCLEADDWQITPRISFLLLLRLPFLETQRFRHTPRHFWTVTGGSL